MWFCRINATVSGFSNCTPLRSPVQQHLQKHHLVPRRAKKERTGAHEEFRPLRHALAAGCPR